MAISPTKVATCPPVDVLGQLVSGSLNEPDAEQLFQHIEDCLYCQSKIDELTNRGDGRLEAAGDGSIDADDQKKLSAMIRKAQDITSNVVREPPIVREAVSVEGFVSSLRRCGLFPEQEIDALLNDVAGMDSSSIAKDLVSRKKLTPFQARVLLKGRWKGLVLGNYVILEKLGQGGMGSVFKAKHRRLGRVVCVKVVNSAGRKSPKMLERFRNEARTVAALSHPNFVVAHDADEAEGVPFLVMEYVEGSDLSKQVSRFGPMPIMEALRATEQVATALQYAHDQGVTHRDIKPHNLLIADDPENGDLHVKILDLGLARFDSLLGENMDASTHAAMTNTGVIMGTVDYMSPEQALRSRDADNRSDIYSLGCTMHYLLTGRPVFDGDTLMARLIAHRETEVPSLEQQCPGAPPALDAVFRRMLAKNPDDRYQSMKELATDLQALLTGGTPAAATGEHARASVSVLDRRRTSRRPPAYRMWLAVCSFLFAVAAIGWSMMPDPQGRAEFDGLSDTTSTASSGESDGTVPPEGAGLDPGELLVRPPLTSIMSRDITFGDGPTMDSGGPPTAVVIVPQQRFDDKEFRAIEEALVRNNVKITVAAPRQGTLNPMHDQSFPLVASETIDELKVDNFDMIFIVGGSTKDFQNVTVADFLASFLASSDGMGRVIAATSHEGYEVLRKAELIDSCEHPHPENGISYGRIGRSGGSVVWTSEHKAIGTAVETAYRIRKAARTPGLHRNTLAGFGSGRAIVILPMNGFSRQEYDLLATALDAHGVERVDVSSEFGAAIPNNGQSEVPVKRLDEMYAYVKASTEKTSFNHLFDYVFVLGGDSDGLKKHAGRELSDLLCLAASDQSVLTGLSKDTQEILNLCPSIKNAAFQQGKFCRFGVSDEGATIKVFDALTSQQQMDTVFAEAQRLRRAASQTLNAL